MEALYSETGGPVNKRENAARHRFFEWRDGRDYVTVTGWTSSTQGHLTAAAAVNIPSTLHRHMCA
jgi:hypothetical protein